MDEMIVGGRRIGQEFCFAGTIRARIVNVREYGRNLGGNAMKLRRRRLLYLSWLAVTINLTIALAAPARSDAAEIKVLTTRAMNHVLTELADAFQRTSEHKIALILAPPNEIRSRIVRVRSWMSSCPAPPRSMTSCKRARSPLVTS